MSRLPHILLAAAVLCSVPVVFGLLGRVHPAFDSFSHFRLHAAIVLALLGVILLATRLRMEGLVSVALAIGSLTTLRPYVLPSQEPRPSATADASVHRLLHLNVRYDNPQTGAVLSLIGRVRPDVVTLTEVTPSFAARLESIGRAYPHRLVCSSPFAFGGVAILSVRPFIGDPAAACAADGRFAVIEVDFGGRAVGVAAVHLAWPWPFEQSAQIAALEPSMAALGDTAIVAGDFNAVGWSAAMDRLARAGRLSLVSGIGATWIHRTLPVTLAPWIGLPIDHVLAKGGLRILDASTGEPVGSDHLPVMVTFELPSPSPAPGGPLQALRDYFRSAPSRLST